MHKECEEWQTIFSFHPRTSHKTPFPLSPSPSLTNCRRVHPSRRKWCVSFFKFSQQMGNLDGNFHPLTFLCRSWSRSPKNHQHLTTMHVRDSVVMSACVCAGATEHLSSYLSCLHNESFECFTLVVFRYDSTRFSVYTFCHHEKYFFALTYSLNTKIVWNFLQHLSLSFDENSQVNKIQECWQKSKGITQFTIAIEDIERTERGA